MDITNSSGKVYVQDLIWDERASLAPLILEKRAYIYICGDARSMSKAVEEKLGRMLAEAKGGKEEDGQKEMKLLKDRNVSSAVSFILRYDIEADNTQRLMTDVWS